MKPKSALRSYLAIASSSLLAISYVHAATNVTWDKGPGTVGVGDSAITGGTGNWDIANGNWTVDAGANNIAWDNLNDDTAIFGGTAGTVTLTTGITAGGLQFDVAGYTVAGNTLTFNTTGNIVTNADATVSSLLAGSTAITKTGTGVLTLNNASSTYSGQLTVANGTLAIAAINNVSANGNLGNSALPVILGSTGNTGTLRWTPAGTGSTTKPFTIASGGTGAIDVVTSGWTLTLSGAFNPSGNFTALGAGALTISGTTTLGAAQTWTNNTPSSGFVTVGNASTAPINIGAHTLTFDGTGITRVFGDLTGAGNLIKNGTGKVTIGGQSFPGTINHAYTGTTTINAGILQMQNNDIGAGNIEINGAVNSAVLSQYFGGTFTRDIGSSSGQMRITGGVSGFSTQGNPGSWGFTGTGSNPLVWGSTNFAPTEFILQASDANVSAGGAFTNNIDLNGANRTIRSDQTGGTAGNGTFSGVISNSTGTAGLIKVGIGHHVLSNTANTYNGNTTITAGTLSAAATGSLGSASNTLIFNGSGVTLRATGTITSPATRAVTLTSSAIIDTNGQAISIAGDMTGASSSLTKNGTGTLTLAGTNNYSGTTVNAGTLAITKEASLNDGTAASWTAAKVNVKNGATLALNVDTLGTAGFTSANLSTLLGNVSSATTAAQGLQAGATIGIDTGASPATFTQGNAITNSTGAFGGIIGLTKLGTGTLVLDKANTYTGITTISAGTIQLSGSGVILGPIVNNGTLLVDKATTVGTDFPAYPALTGSGSIAANTGATLTISTATALQNIALNTTGGGSFILSGVTAPIFGGLSGATGDLATVISSGYAGVTNLTLNTPSGSTFTYGGVIANNAANLSLTKTGDGTQILQGANTYTGATFLNAGTLTLSGAAGALTATSGITLNGGTTLTLINTSAAQALLDRVVANPIISNGGAITVTNSGATTYSETMGVLDLRRGQLNVTQTNSSGTQTLTFGSGSLTTVNGVARTNGTTSAINFAGTSLGAGVGNTIKITGQADTLQNEIIAPWATFGGADYAVYNRAGSAAASANTLGIQAANITATDQSLWSTTFAATSNYTLTNTATSAANGRLGGTRSVNTLRSTTARSTVASIASNVITITGSSFKNDDVLVNTSTAGPTGLTRETAYYVVGNPEEDATFQLAATPGGTPITGLSGTGFLTSGITLSSGKNLETYGLLGTNSTAHLVIGRGTTGGVLTTPTGGGNLYLTTGGGGIVIDAPITDNGGAVTVVKNGTTGTLTLSGNNTFTGGLVVNAGGANNNVRMAGTQSFTGGITLNGGGIGDNSANGTLTTLATSLNGNAITANGPSHLVVEGTLPTTSTITINPNAVLKLGAGNSTLTVGGVVSGSGVLDANPNNVNSNTTLNLTNTLNSFSGDVIYAASNGGTTLSVSSIGDSGKVTVGLAVNTAIKTFALNSAASAALTFNTRQFELTGTTGAHNLAIANSSAQAFNINTDLLVTGTGTRTLTLGGSGAGLGTFAGTITNGTLTTLNLAKADSGTWELTNTANSYNGTTTVSGGTLGFANGALGSVGTINASGGTLKWLSGNTQDVSSRLAMTAATTSSFDTNGNNVTFATGIGGGTTGALTKKGAGTLTLGGTNTYTGTTTVDAGTLLVNGSLGAGAVTVNGGDLGGTGTIGGTVTVNAAGSVAPGASAGQLSIGGGLNISAPVNGGAGKLKFELGANTASSDRIAVTGTLTIGAAKLGFLDFNFSNSGWQDGTYKLITSGAISGTIDVVGNRTGPIGAGTGTLQITGNDLELVVTGAGGGGNIAPTISDIANQSVPSGGNTGALAFTITDEDVNSVTPTGSSSNVTLVPNANIVFGGSGASRTVTVTPVSGLSGTATITVTLTDNGALTAQDTFTLTVTDNFLSWATANGVTGGANGDHDNDGVKNLVEYALVNGGERGVLSGNTITYTKRGTPYGTDMTYIIETSETLVGAWTDAVTHSPALLVSNPTISYTFTPGTPVKKFARLEVVATP